MTRRQLFAALLSPLLMPLLKLFPAKARPVASRRGERMTDDELNVLREFGNQIKIVQTMIFRNKKRIADRVHMDITAIYKEKRQCL